jgi:hypothetical protein
MSSRVQSRKVREFLAKKKLEEEESLKQELEKIEKTNLYDNQIAMSMQLFYDVTIRKCIDYLNNKETIPVIKILKKMISDGYDIDYIMIRILAHGNLLLYQFIKQERRDLINHFEAYDEIVRAQSSDEIIKLLKYDILDLEHSTKVNKMDSLSDTVYMFMQLSDYNDNVEEFLWQRYSSILSVKGLMHHQLFYNIPHEIAIYMKSLKGDELNESLVNLDKILLSYHKMEQKFKNSPMLKGRLLNVIKMISQSVINNDLKLPSKEEFFRYFGKIYIIHGAEKPDFLKKLEWDIYWHIDCEIMQQRAYILFPYEGENGQWV